MKNISKKILSIFIVFLLMLSTNSVNGALAVNNDIVNYDNDIMLLDGNLDSEEVLDNNLLVDDVYNEDYDDDYYYEEDNDGQDEEAYEKNFFYAGSHDVNIDNPVSGDVFVFSSGTVNINTVITGNVFVCAPSVIVSDNAEIDASLFNFSNTLTINGYVGINVYNCSKKIALKGDIEADLFSVSQDTNINGSVMGNANISSENISVSQDAYIAGNLNYSSKEKITVPENAHGGSVNYSISSNKDSKSETTITEFVESILSFIVLAILLFVICKWLRCKFIDSYPDFVKNLPKSLLYGLLGLLVTPILALILLFGGITANLSLIIIAMYTVLLAIASSVSIIVLSKLASNKLHEKFEKMNDTLLTILTIAVFSIAYKLLQLIPTLGFIITLAFVMVGIGILIKNIIPTKEQKNS